MTDEELRVRAIQELEFYKKDDTFMLADITVDLAIEALEQMSVTTTAGEGGVIYYPQVEGVTPTVIKQEPCEEVPCDNCKYLDGDGCRLVFEQIEYGKASDECPNDNYELSPVNPQPCEDAISRQAVLDLAKEGILVSNGNYKAVCKAINDLPPVNPQPKTGHWIPVSERLPEDKTYVLTTIKVPNRIAHARSSWYEGGFFHNDNGDTWRATDMEVVAWMPLPKPYEPQERSDKE